VRPGGFSRRGRPRSGQDVGAWLEAYDAFLATAVRHGQESAAAGEPLEVEVTWSKVGRAEMRARRLVPRRSRHHSPERAEETRAKLATSWKRHWVAAHRAVYLPRAHPMALDALSDFNH
jgi:hypothetical protein